jgi:colanic acid/amylovoran biosynthesis protein
MLMTGDDAVEQAYQVRPNALGSGIGLSIRVSSYTRLDVNRLSVIRQVLYKLSKKFNAELIAVPTSSAHHEADISYIKEVLSGFPHARIGWRKLSPYHDAIERVGRCRVMVSGTYHGSIFALSQGIPVIGIAQSDEYFYKLSEIGDEFGDGCVVIRLGADGFEESFEKAIENAWKFAEELRLGLLNIANNHIILQDRAYQRIFDILASKKSGN